MRHLLFVLPLLLATMPAAQAQVSVGIGVSVPGVSIGINLPVYPEFERVPGYPVYYAPQAQGNYFFFDGLYWVFQGDDWYASSWYNGPWRSVARYDVPGYMLRVPVRYYRQPPMVFRSWRADAPPRWGDHWGGRLAAASLRLGAPRPPDDADARTPAGLPAQVPAKSLSARGRAAATDPRSELPLPAARPGCASGVGANAGPVAAWRSAGRAAEP